MILVPIGRHDSSPANTTENALQTSISVPDSEWKLSGEYLDDPHRRLLAHIVICGTSMHLEAYEAIRRSDEDGGGIRLYDDDADRALSIFVGEGGFPNDTTTIRGREYIIVATPFA